MIISLKAQPLRDLFQKGRDLLILRLYNDSFCVSFSVTCIDSFSYVVADPVDLYDLEVTDTLDSGETGMTRLTGDTLCIPDPKNFLRIYSNASKTPFKSLVLAPFSDDSYFFGELVGEKEVFHFGRLEKLKHSTFYTVDLDEVSLHYAHLSGEETHPNLHLVWTGMGFKMLVNTDVSS